LLVVSGQLSAVRRSLLVLVSATPQKRTGSHGQSLALRKIKFQRDVTTSYDTSRHVTTKQQNGIENAWQKKRQETKLAVSTLLLALSGDTANLL
jgi:hypothetical protein